MANFDLNKVKFVLEKRQINEIPCEVVFGIDVSASMRGLFERGIVQTITEKIFTIAATVDIDKKLGMCVFDSTGYILTPVTEDNINGYINSNIVHTYRYWNGTRYAAIINSIIDLVKNSYEKESWFSKLFNKSKTGYSQSKDHPTLAIIITDGEPQDTEETTKLMKKIQSQNIFWQWVNIDPHQQPETFLTQMNSRYSNMDVISIQDINQVSDDDLYDQLISDKFANWVVNFK